MDTITQGLLGAAVGQALFSKKLGRGAAWWGALGGVLPDADILPASLMGSMGEMLYHRGPTHALWFGPVLAPILGYAVWRIKKSRANLLVKPPPERGEIWIWTALFFATIFTHPLLDIFTSYGTQLFTPFSDMRVALHSVSIIDPFYSAPLAAALILGSAFKTRPRAAQIIAATALVLTTMYLFYGLRLNQRAKSEAGRQLAAEGVTDARVNAYPTLLQPYQRRIVARAGGEVRVGELSLWRRPRAIQWARYTPPAGPLIDEVLKTPEGRTFQWFALGETIPRVTETEDRTVVEIEDLRYGFGFDEVKGMWGVRAEFDKQGRMILPPRRIERRLPEKPSNLLKKMWRDTFR